MQEIDMTVIICSNEHNLIWVFDERLPHRWRGRQETPTGEYISMAAAFVGDPLEVVYMQETESGKVLLTDSKWTGILSYLEAEVHHSQEPDWILSHYPDFASPYADQIKQSALEYAQEYNQPTFDIDTFVLASWVKHDLRKCQVKTAVNYAKRIFRGCKNLEGFVMNLNKIFERIKTIERLHLLTSKKEIDCDDPSIVASVLGNPIPTSEDRQLTQVEIDMKYFLEGIDLSQLD
jgi:hypothetical protein